MTQRTLILNGFESDDPMGARMSAMLSEAIARHSGTSKELCVRDLKLGYCTGCFGCFVRQPGACLFRDDARAVLESLIRSEVLVLTGRMAFGGYSSTLKRMVDRLLPVLLPFFFSVRGEFHHPARYDKLPRLVVIGVPPDAPQGADPVEADVFRALVGRNAINLNAPTHACEIVESGSSDEAIARQMDSVLRRSDPRPWRAELAGLVARTHPASATAAPPTTRSRLLMLIGSPKLGPSTSGVIGDYVAARMGSRGWDTERLVLKGELRRQSGRSQLVEAAERADVICLAFPLYIDSLHTLPTLALEILAAERARWAAASPKRFMVVVNCGFPEAHQNDVALAICKRFARRAGWTWCGGLALGGGEALIGGAPLDAQDTGANPRAANLRRALDLSLEALLEGRAFPRDAQALLERSPIAALPNIAWRGLFRVMGGRAWRTEARRWQVEPKALYARPLLASREEPGSIDAVTNL